VGRGDYVFGFPLIDWHCRERCGNGWRLASSVMSDPVEIGAEPARDGLTSARSLVLGDEALYREWGYTALSRAKTETLFYVTRGARDAAEDDVSHESVHYQRRGVLAEATGQLTVSRAPEMATDVKERTDKAALDPAAIAKELEAIRKRIANAKGPGSVGPNADAGHEDDPDHGYDRDQSRDGGRGHGAR
jgi:hypothetical protein